MASRSTLLFASILLCITVTCIAQTNNDLGVKCSKECNDGLICLNSTCQYCTNDEQCKQVSGTAVCKKTQFLKIVEHLCLHKSLFGTKASWHDIVSFLIVIIACAFAAGGGIGGGGIYVPVLILVGQFMTKEAIPLSNIVVTGSSIANLFVNFRKRNPSNANKPLIDYSVALLIEPQTLGGTIIGVYLHNMFPSYLILALLILVMTFTTIRSFMKGVELYKKERRQSTQCLPNEATSLMNLQDTTPRKEVPVYKLVSWVRVIALLAILGISTVLAFLKGGGGAVSIIGVKACSPVYWVVACAVFPVIFAIWGFEGFLVIRSSNQRKGTPKTGEIEWSFWKVFGVGIVSFIAGIMASLLGVGGGIIKGPVLLELGLAPDVVSATSAYMIVFTSISASIQYIIIGSVMPDYGVILFLLGLVGSFIGRITLDWIVRKYQKQSFIIFVIATVIGISAVLLVASEVIQFKTQGGDNSFNWGCPAYDDD